MTLIKIETRDQDAMDQSLNQLLKPTDQFVIGKYPVITAKDTSLSGEIILPGIVAYDPNSAINIAARISGRIEKMYVNYRFQKVFSCRTYSTCRFSVPEIQADQAQRKRKSICRLASWPASQAGHR